MVGIWGQVDIQYHGSGVNGIRTFNFETNALLLKAETTEIVRKMTWYFDWLKVC